MFGRNGEPDRLTEHTCGQISQDINHEAVSQLANKDGKVIQEAQCYDIHNANQCIFEA
jgi:hypothetical protein